MRRPPYRPVPLSELRDGLRLRKEMRLYLDSERYRIDEVLEEAFRIGLTQFPIGSSEVARAPGYWEKLVDACTTIGSRSIERIEKRLQIIGHSLRWEPGFDYRTLAHQLYMATDQSRKIKNAYLQRRKCVKAVLNNIDQNEVENMEYRHSLSKVHGDRPEDFEQWFKRAFQLFANEGALPGKMYTVYEKEWKEFTKSFIEVCLSRSQSVFERFVEAKYEEYIESLKYKLTQSTYRFGESRNPRNDIDLSKDLALNLKLNSGELIMMYEFQNPIQVDIMSLSSEIFFELMNKYQIESLGVLPIQTGNKGIRIELPKPDKPDVLPKIQSTVMEIFAKYTN